MQPRNTRAVSRPSSLFKRPGVAASSRCMRGIITELRHLPRFDAGRSSELSAIVTAQPTSRREKMATLFKCMALAALAALAFTWQSAAASEPRPRYRRLPCSRQACLHGVDRTRFQSQRYRGQFASVSIPGGYRDMHSHGASGNVSVLEVDAAEEYLRYLGPLQPRRRRLL